jgi:hypothetical protein
MVRDIVQLTGETRILSTNSTPPLPLKKTGTEKKMPTNGMILFVPRSKPCDNAYTTKVNRNYKRYN